MERKLETILNNIFCNINDWLKFAEQKNSTLIVLNAGLIWGVARILNNSVIDDSYFFVFIYIAYTLLIVSTLICIYSFMPILKNRWWLKKDKKDETDNIFYFGDIAKYNSIDYLILLQKKCDLKDYSVTNLEKDYSQQIVINSKIALDKYNNFKVSSQLTTLGIIIFLLCCLSILIIKG